MSAVKASAVHHIGVSVGVLDEALRFWEPFLGRAALAAQRVVTHVSPIG